MANTTIRGAFAIHGQNPQHLVETVIRNRIYESQFWKEHCFALTAATLIDRAIEMKYIGGVYGANNTPTEFMSLLLKLLQIQPEKEILIEYLQVDEFKYLRALAAMYIRLTFRSAEVYEILEPLLKDYRKLRLRNVGGYSLIHMDEFVDQLLHDERVCDIILPRMTKRDVLEELEEIGPRKSLLLDAMEGKSDGERSRGRSPSGSERSRSPSRDRNRSSRSPSSERDEGSRRSRSRSASASGADSRYVSRSPSRSRSGSCSPYISRSRSITPNRMDTDVQNHAS